MIIDVPSLHIQDQIVEMQILFAREKQLTEAIQSKRQELLQAISRKLITGQIADQE